MWLRFRAWIVKHERYLSVLVFVGGFLLDAFTLHFLTLSQVALLLGCYIGAAALAILIGHAVIGERQGAGRILELGAFVFPLIGQFFIGGALSGLVIFYSMDSSFLATWPFLLLLAAVFISTEAFSKYRSRLAFQSGLWFFTAYAYTVFTLPILLGHVDRTTFILSGVLAAAVFIGFLYLLKTFGKERVEGRLMPGTVAALVILILAHVGYFLGVIPPFPLTLADKGIYHAIERQGSEFVLVGQQHSRLPFVTPVIHHGGGSLYAFSAIFAPAAFSTHIVHHWEYFDTATDTWVEKSRVDLPIRGGRDGGYRTYSVSSKVTPGKWRVAVKTPEDLVIGYIPFIVEPGIPTDVTTERY